VRKNVPKLLRADLKLFQLGTSFRRERKDRDVWELADSPVLEPKLYYEDYRPALIG
jgi:hypothetical protein